MAGRASDRIAEKLLGILDEAGPGAVEGVLDALAREGGESGHATLIRALTHMSLGEGEARSVVEAALRHREEIRLRLGRDVGARVALFDYLVGVARRITDPKIIDIGTFERIERSAAMDGLTSLYNRASFDARLQIEIRRARRYGQHLSLLLLDLDAFKTINDTRGHLVGDRVLRETGRLIVERIRDIDIAARYGGEEFAVILPETRRNGAYVVAERVRSEMERRFRKRGALDRAVRATLSGGLACYPEDAEDPDGLIARADEALYRAKQAGKNLIKMFFEEKRRDERVEVEERGLRAVLQGHAPAGALRRSGRVRNISEGGILVEISEPVPVGSRLQVSFSLGRDEDFTLPSTVVRIEEKGTNGKRRRFAAGLRFQKRARNLQPRLHRLARRQAAAG